uniref:(northern house mosquito) hypothetical protein n=1 Tax=Culex pipiens TaxID=7175 RepID=A0A8D8NTW4_CULPI
MAASSSSLALDTARTVRMLTGIRCRKSIRINPALTFRPVDRSCILARRCDGRASPRSQELSSFSNFSSADNSKWAIRRALTAGYLFSAGGFATMSEMCRRTVWSTLEIMW